MSIKMNALRSSSFFQDSERIHKASRMCLILILLVAISSSIGCSSPEYEHVNVNDIERRYLITVPEEVENTVGPVPLFLVFHGGGSNAVEVKERSNFDSVAEQNNMIVVYPEGTPKNKFGTHATWNVGERGGGEAYAHNVDDIAFFDILLAKLQSEYNIDNNKIFVTGISMGGMMSYKLACERSQIVAGAAPIAASLTIESCNPEEPVSILHFHGTEDKFVPYEGGNSDTSLPKILVIGSNYRSAEESDAIMAQSNRCSEEKTTALQFEDILCESYEGCESPTITCSITGGGHTWPGAPPAAERILGKTTQSISATHMITNFFIHGTLSNKENNEQTQ